MAAHTNEYMRGTATQAEVDETKTDCSLQGQAQRSEVSERVLRGIKPSTLAAYQAHLDRIVRHADQRQVRLRIGQESKVCHGGSEPTMTGLGRREKPQRARAYESLRAGARAERSGGAAGAKGGEVRRGPACECRSG